MQYKLCFKCGYKESCTSVMDIYAVTDSKVFWSCPKCNNIEQITLTEFLSRCEQDSQTTPPKKIETLK